MVSLKRSMSTRARSSIPQFRVRVPAKVVHQLRGKRVLLSLSNPNDRPCIKIVTVGNDVAFSLETDDQLIAEARQSNALDHFRRLFELTEAEPVNLSHKDMVALSGAAYRLYNEIHADNPGEPGAWTYHKSLTRASLEGRIQNPPPAALTPDGASAALKLFGNGNLTEAVPYRLDSTMPWKSGSGFWLTGY
jgi:hypothetical protein